MYSIFEIREPDPPYYGVTPVKPDATLRERLERNLSFIRSSGRYSSPFMKPSRCNRLVNRLKMATNRVTVAMM